MDHLTAARADVADFLAALPADQLDAIVELYRSGELAGVLDAARLQAEWRRAMATAMANYFREQAAVIWWLHHHTARRRHHSIATAAGSRHAVRSAAFPPGTAFAGPAE